MCVILICGCVSVWKVYGTLVNFYNGIWTLFAKNTVQNPMRNFFYTVLKIIYLNAWSRLDIPYYK